MSVLGALGTIGTILGGVGSVAGSLFNSQKVSEVGSSLSGLGSTLMAGQSVLSGIEGAKEQSALSREVFDYQKSLQNRIFEREDTAVQRRALDLEKAGLSKTLSAGSSAGAGSVVSTNVPQSSEMLKSQALVNGINSMLSIAQSKANIALSEAQASKVSAEAREIEHNLGWYSGNALPTGVKDGILFTVGGMSNLLGVSNQDIARAVYNGLRSVASKFDIDLPELEGLLKEVPDSSSMSASVNFPFFADNNEVTLKSNPVETIRRNLISREQWQDPIGYSLTKSPTGTALNFLIEKLIINNKLHTTKAAAVVSEIFTSDKVAEDVGLNPVSKTWKDYVNSFKSKLYEALRSVNSKFFGGK